MKKTASLLLKSCLAASFLLASAWGLQAQTITGTVFEDYNANGLRDVGEPGVGGITVNGYLDGDAAGAPTHTATTALNGAYSINTGGNDLRLEFVIPTPLVYLRQGAAGSTNVVFASDGATGVNVGFNNPSNYSIANPIMATSCYLAGDYNDPIGGLRDAFVGVFYDWGRVPTVADNDDVVDENGNNRTPLHFAFNNEIGTTFGLAWNRTTNTAYLSAYQKKHTDFGPGGPGAIYQVQIDPVSGLALSAPSVFVDVDGFSGISVCGSHGNDLNPASDPATANLVGKCALGDLDISDDNTKLYTVNLNDKKIIEIDIATGTMSNNWNFPALSQNDCFSCANANDVRPFGLKYRNGKLYVGAVCSSEISQDDTEINAFVYQLDPTTGTFTEFFCFNWNDLDQGDNNPWISGADQETLSPNPNRFYIFTDIEFYGNDLIMSFRDRHGDMLGANVPGVSPDAQPRGEIITAWFNTSTGQYVLESSADGSAGPDRPGPGAPNTGGFGDDTEFYWQDGYNTANPYSGARHSDQSFGGLAQINVQDIIMTALTPRQPHGVGQTGAGGFSWLSNTLGTASKCYTLYDSGDIEPGTTLSKANGLGDIEGLTTPAPIEIGDYVWVDTDQDGVQDPGETPIQGVTVGLYKNGNLIATDVTDANGKYLFTSLENPVYSGAEIAQVIETNDNTQDNRARQFSNGNMEVGSFDINDEFREWGAIRFVADIPQGATITSAYVQFQSDDSGLPESDPSEVRFYAEDVDDSPLFVDVSNNLSSRTRTSAFVDWTVPAFTVPAVATANERSPSLVSIVQEVIDRAGWSSGNHLSFLIERGLNGNDGDRTLQGRPVLVVEWTSATPVSGTNTGDILPDMAYEVRLDLSQSPIATPGYTLTTANSAASGSLTSNDPGADIRDSDGTDNAGTAVIAFTTGAWGENNHGLDFGVSDAANCSLNTPTIVATCDDNGTPADPNDDTFMYTINVTGTNTGATYSISGDDTRSGLAYNTVNGPYGPFPITGGDLTITITDVDDAGCQLVNQTVTAPATCSNTCELNAPTIVATCNDNGTPADPSDDTFMYTINVTGTNTGATYSISGDDTRSGLAYNTVNGPYGPFPITGGDLTITITDVDNAGCQLVNQTVTAPATCSSSNDGCDCTDFIYVNDTDVGTGVTHRFEVDPTDGSVTESPSLWLPSNMTIQNNHGIAQDLNGNLYVAGTSEGDIFRLDAFGNILTPTPWFNNDPVVNGIQVKTINYGFRDNTMYTVSADYRFVVAIDLCTGEILGRMFLYGGVEEFDANVWGFYVDDNNWYAVDRGTASNPLSNSVVYSGPLDESFYAPIGDPVTNAGTALFTLQTPNGSTTSNSSYRGGMGITRDVAGNFYVVEDQRIDGGNDDPTIVKYDASGNPIASMTNATPLTANASNGLVGWAGARGITYSPASDKVYVGSKSNCLTVFETDLTELISLNIGNPADGRPKAIGIVTQCCPASTPQNLTNTICYDGTNDETVNLQRFLECEGIITEGDWTEISDPNNVFTYNACNESVTVSGIGCAVYRFSADGNGANNVCGAFQIDVTICTTDPPTNGSPVVMTGTCGIGNIPNADATATISSIVNADVAGISAAGTTFYNGPAYNSDPSMNPALFDVSGGTLNLSNLEHGKSYVVRLFNQGNGCSRDVLVTVPTIDCNCSLNAPTIVATCNDNGTPSDPSDDTFTYTINVTGSNTGATYSISGDDTRSGLAYNTVNGPYGPFPIAGGDLTITITDVDDAGCQLVNQTVTAPAACSNDCPTIPCGTTTVIKN
ncbi:MAG: hypothetical protein H6556_29170 [Lewinellaceae bacterium]|nr:hypothetical protein [Lewinellaceae bacterium]